jgi:uncharacterized protein DUF6702
VVTRRLVALLAASLAIAVTPSLSWSHPLHTTLADVSIESDGSLRLLLRAFADDFSAAVARHAGKPRPADFVVADPDVAAYMARTVAIQDSDGRTVPLVWAGSRRTGDLMWITMRAPGVRSLKGVRVVYSTLFDAFPDQVNILQANENGRRHTVLFTASDGRSWKPIL